MWIMLFCMRILCKFEMTLEGAAINQTLRREKELCRVSGIEMFLEPILETRADKRGGQLQHEEPELRQEGGHEKKMKEKE